MNSEQDEKVQLSPAQLRNLLQGTDLSIEQLESIIAELIPTEIQEEHYYSSDAGIIDLDLICDDYDICIPASWGYKVQEAFLCLAYSYGPYGHKIAQKIHQLAEECIDTEKMLFFFNVAKALALVAVERKMNYAIECYEEDASDTSESAGWREEVQLNRILMQQKIMTSCFPQGDELLATMASIHTVRKHLREEENVPLEPW